MRLDEASAPGTVAAAIDAGVTVFDTAHAYPGNERQLARALRARGIDAEARIVTKGGMTRAGGAWIPDGRAKAIAADCEASLTDLDGIPIDLYLLHAPDPRTPWRTSVRALARLREQGLVGAVGVCNVNRAQLDEACELAPIAAVQVALSWADDGAIRGGVVARCEELGITVIAHSPLGGPRRAGAVGRAPELRAVAERHGATAHEIALAWLLSLSPAIVAIPGARRPETAASAAQAAAITLTEDDRERLGHRGPRGGQPRAATTEVVLVMGIPGAGKSRATRGYVERGYLRLNRDELGGTLKEVAGAMEEVLSGASVTKVVLDNTYLTRASRNLVIEVAARHGAAVRCVWLDTPLQEAQVNLVERLVNRFGALPTPEQIRAAREPGVMLPTSQMRALRELEPPSADEGFVAIERIPFERAGREQDPRAAREDDARASGGMAERRRSPSGVLIAAGALEQIVPAELPDGPVLVFDWRPGGGPEDLGPLVPRLVAAAPDGRRVVDLAICPHGGGPPSCWCRPPLPGLPVAFAHARGIDLARSTLIGNSNAHRTLARVVRSTFVLCPAGRE
jgi:aryl-alcohol dehydrogenase-like predicted oxidoreductase